MALVGYFIVFSFVTKPGQTLEFLLRGTIVLLLQVPHNLRCTRSQVHPHTVLRKVYTEDLLLFPSIVPFVVGLKLFYF